MDKNNYNIKIVWVFAIALLLFALTLQGKKQHNTVRQTKSQFFKSILIVIDGVF